ncbi:C39 family peptidase [Dysgonomonas sp. Marseille-P4677]|uniref:C39 family peptidase n=1 Tax=Dysgonomonas sp. Marseille-P4677 TaxID=2364790 RepID=UPI00191450FC|nr:C39 family peptidase [Dysgonomonas sp. Marseille-P4677]MBK5722125.1 C39 family peptidase [Dysgonomonas sp. Marseille-P4677]
MTKNVDDLKLRKFSLQSQEAQAMMSMQTMSSFSSSGSILDGGSLKEVVVYGSASSSSGSKSDPSTCIRCGAKYEWGECPNCDKGSSGSYSYGSNGSYNWGPWASGSYYGSGSGSYITSGGGTSGNNTNSQDNRNPNNFPLGKPQIHNADCGPTCIEQTLKYLGAWSTYGEFIQTLTSLLNITQLDIAKNGLNVEQMLKAVSYFFDSFEITDLSLLPNEIEKRNPIFSNIKLKDGTNHSVVILGYEQQNGNHYFKYYDPLDTSKFHQENVFDSNGKSNFQYFLVAKDINKH